MESTALLAPILALALLNLIVLCWLYLLRIPAMVRAGTDPQKGKHTSDLTSLPNPARQVGDNYNHLLEQPTLFYAVALAIFVAGHSDAIHLYCAWGFVGARTLHTLIQCTYNKVMHRFSVFMLSSAILAVMVVREILALI